MLIVSRPVSTVVSVISSTVSIAKTQFPVRSTERLTASSLEYADARSPKVVAERLVAELERSGFVIMRRPPPDLRDAAGLKRIEPKGQF
jgi:hypothetical protein